MSVGLLAVVDDILSAALKASAKSAGVVIDDAAVTPQYVQGITPARELPVIGKIALGSLVNKFVIIIPIGLLLTAFAPWVLPWLLIVGGAFLCYEGAEKVLEWFGRGGHTAEDPNTPRNEGPLVWGAIRTDLILSTEIMLISLASLEAGLSLGMQIAVLSVVGLAMTVLVYGTVAALVKMDDVGLRLSLSRTGGAAAFGRRIVDAMPTVFTVISVIGAVAMLWVGGHLVLHNLGAVGVGVLSDFLHGVEAWLAPAGGFVVWLGDTVVSFIGGIIAGLVIVALIGLVRAPFRREPAAHG